MCAFLSLEGQALIEASAALKWFIGLI